MNRARNARALAPLAALALALPAHAFVANGGFQTGALAPWAVANTPSGTTLFSNVMTHDMDGPGPLPPSPAATLMVGQTAFNTGLQGATLAQPTFLEAGRTFEIRVRIAVWALVNVYSRSGGHFELVVDGLPLATFTAPNTFQGQNVYAALGANFTAAESRIHSVGVRVRRDIMAGEEVFQFIDDARMRLACPGDVNEDTLINFADLNLILSTFGASGAPGQLPADANFDGVVNFSDLNIVLSNFAQPC